MAYIQQELTDPSYLVEIGVLQKDDEKYWEPWRIVTLSASERMTPAQMQELGRRLIRTSRYIRRTYTANGNVKRGRKIIDLEDI